MVDNPEANSVPDARFDALALTEFATQLLKAAGLPLDRASVVASIFVEADLLGYSTHGVARLDSNLQWLQKGETRVSGDPHVLVNGGSVEVWDARFLPGPWVTMTAVRKACLSAQEFGVCSISIRRAQHIACLAAYLQEATDKGLMILLSVTTPSEAVVAPYGSVDRVFSCNPLSIGIPTAGDPILIDTTTAMSAQGPLFRSYELHRTLPAHSVISRDGVFTDDPAEFVERGGAILPTGGPEQGYKGYGLCLFTEALAALAGAGRMDTSGEGEANSVFVQVFDPSRFGGRDVFQGQMSHLADLCRRGQPWPGGEAVRVPGDRALADKRRQAVEGVKIRASILTKLSYWSNKFSIEMPGKVN